MIVAMFVLLSAGHFKTEAAVHEAGTWKEWETGKNVPENKTWSIQFSQKIDPTTVNDSSLYVEDEYGNRIPVKTVFPKENVIAVSPSQQLYEKGQTYTLFILDTIQSNGIKLLKEPVRMKFSIQAKDPSAEFVTRSDSSNTITFKDGVKELDSDLKFTVEGSEVTINNPAGLELKPGDVFFLPATKEYPFGQQKKVADILQNDSSALIMSVTEPEFEEVISEMDLSQKITLQASDFVINEEIFGNTSSRMEQDSEKKRKPSIEVIDHAKGTIELAIRDLPLGKNSHIDGEIILKDPEILIDIGDKNKKSTFNGVLYTASHELNFKLKAAYGVETDSEEAKIYIGQFPVPFASTPTAGAIVKLYLFADVNGEIKIEYTYSRTLDTKFGIIKNAGKKTYDTIDEIEFHPATQELSAEGKGSISTGVLAEVGVNLGSFTLTGLQFTLDARAEAKGKIVQINDREPKSCFNVRPGIGWEGKFLIEKEVKLIWDFNFKYEKELYTKAKYFSELGNCGYENLNLLPKRSEFLAGETVELSVAGVRQLLSREIQNISIPNNFIVFSSDNPTVARINDDGKLEIRKDAPGGSIANITVSYEDPITEEIQTYTKQVLVKEEPKGIQKENLGMLVTDLAGNIDRAMHEAKEQGLSLSQMQERLRPFATPEFIFSKEIEDYYINKACFECDVSFFKYYSEKEMQFRLRFPLNTPNEVQVNLTSIGGLFRDPGLADYTFLKINGDWKIASYTFDMIMGSKSLNITEEEALEIAKLEFSYGSNSNLIQSKLINTSLESVRDRYTGELIVRKLYLIEVFDGNRTWKVEVFEHTGFHI